MIDFWKYLTIVENTASPVATGTERPGLAANRPSPGAQGGVSSYSAAATAQKGGSSTSVQEKIPQEILSRLNNYGIEQVSKWWFNYAFQVAELPLPRTLRYKIRHMEHTSLSAMFKELSPKEIEVVIRALNRPSPDAQGGDRPELPGLTANRPTPDAKRGGAKTKWETGKLIDIVREKIPQEEIVSRLNSQGIENVAKWWFKHAFQVAELPLPRTLRYKIRHMEHASLSAMFNELSPEETEQVIKALNRPTRDARGLL